MEVGVTEVVVMEGGEAADMAAGVAATAVVAATTVKRPVDHIDF